MEFATGKSKALDDMTIKDFKDHPIWVWALDEEGVPGQDETWQKPVIGATEVTPELVSNFLTLNIAFKVIGTDLEGAGDYDHERGEIGGFALWRDGQWMPNLCEIEALIYPLTFEAVPAICGKSAVRFVCESQDSFSLKRIG